MDIQVEQLPKGFTPIKLTIELDNVNEAWQMAAAFLALSKAPNIAPKIKQWGSLARMIRQHLPDGSNGSSVEVEAEMILKDLRQGR